MSSARNEALINPSVLLWARETAGFNPEEAAKKANLKAAKLLACERGEQRLSIPQLRKLSNIYKRPLALFYLPEPPVSEIDSKIKDFRRFFNNVEQGFSPDLRLEIRKAKYRRDVALEMFEKLEIDFPRFVFQTSLETGIESLSEDIRNFLNISKQRQEKLNDDSQALRFWRESIESHGILVFQTTSKISTSEMRGFSLGDLPLPIIVVNRKDSYRARVFTLIHELTHIMLNSTGICDVNLNLNGQKKIEIFCNAVAGETLVPSNWLTQTSQFRGIKKESELSSQIVKELADKFSVSRKVVARRLLALGRISDKVFHTFNNRLDREYEVAKKAKEGKTKEGGPNFYRLKISEIGKSYASLVLNGYHQKKIGLLEASGYLGVKATHVSTIEKMVFDLPKPTGD